VGDELGLQQGAANAARHKPEIVSRPRQQEDKADSRVP